MPAELSQHPEVKHFRVDVAVAANTAAAAATATNVALGLVIVDSIEVLIPIGHAGLTGLRVTYDGATVLPWTQDDRWLIGDDIERVFALGLPISHPLVVRAFNTDDTFPHTFYLNIAYRDQVASLEETGNAGGVDQVAVF